MGTCHNGNVSSSVDELLITEAAITTFRQLLDTLTGRITTHGYGDGGLICEDRTNRARPRIFRIAADGELLPDSIYSFSRGGFVRAPAPRQVVGGTAHRAICCPPVNPRPRRISVRLRDRVGRAKGETSAAEASL